MSKTKSNQTPETMEEFLSKIDFKELKKQKFELIKIQDKAEKNRINLSQKQMDSLEGLLCLIDRVQDIAVDQYGYSEFKVFRRTRKDI